jgi:hypothetical protein
MAMAEEAIERATGQRPTGFRGPGFSLCPSAPRVLARRGYDYDASTFPTFLGPLARAYMFLHSRYTPEQKRERRALFGSLRDFALPNNSYVWDVPGGGLVEIPVTTMPFMRVPIHATYVMYLAGVSERLAEAYGRFALSLCRATGVQPSFLLHPIDFIDLQDASEMAFFPTMRLPSSTKRRVLRSLLQWTTDRFDVVTMSEHAAFVARQADTAMVLPQRKWPAEASSPR